MLAEKTIEVTRFKNLLLLFQQFETPLYSASGDLQKPQRGALAKFAKRLGMNPVMLSQLKAGPQRKVIGTSVSDKIEKALNLPDGWMDTPHASAPEIPAQAALDTSANGEPLALLSEGEQDFVRCALVLYRKDPLRAQTELLRVFAARLES